MVIMNKPKLISSMSYLNSYSDSGLSKPELMEENVRLQQLYAESSNSISKLTQEKEDIQQKLDSKDIDILHHISEANSWEKLYKDELDKNNKLKTENTSLKEKNKSLKEDLEEYRKKEDKTWEYDIISQRIKSFYDKHKLGTDDTWFDTKDYFKAISDKFDYNTSRVDSLERYNRSLLKQIQHYKHLEKEVLSEWDYEQRIEFATTAKELNDSIVEYYNNFKFLPSMLGYKSVDYIKNNKLDMMKYLSEQKFTPEIYCYIRYKIMDKYERDKYEVDEDIIKQYALSNSIYYNMYNCFMNETSYALVMLRMRNKEAVLDLFEQLEKGVEFSLPLDEEEIIEEKLQLLKDSDEDPRYKEWVSKLFTPLVQNYNCISLEKFVQELLNKQMLED